MKDGDKELLSEQLTYYRARAPEYDRWWYRTEQYVLPPERKAEWDEEISRLEAAIDEMAPHGDVLELACGTGLWTERLSRHARHITAVDGSPEALALNRARLGDAAVDYVEADLFAWRPDAAYDVVFFSFWLSHVPTAAFAEFWATVGGALRPGGRAIFIDNRWGDATASASEAARMGDVETRDLSDGRTYRIVKLYYEPEELATRLRDVGWDSDVRASGRSFIYGSARPSANS
jgi:SAM-dependent methyltransferase